MMKMLEALRWLRHGAANCASERGTKGRVTVNCHVNVAFQGGKWDTWTGPVKTENCQSGTV